jgi:hypothetical protein
MTNALGHFVILPNGQVHCSKIKPKLKVKGEWGSTNRRYQGVS